MQQIAAPPPRHASLVPTHPFACVCVCVLVVAARIPLPGLDHAVRKEPANLFARFKKSRTAQGAFAAPTFTGFPDVWLGMTRWIPQSAAVVSISN